MMSGDSQISLSFRERFSTVAALEISKLGHLRKLLQSFHTFFNSLSSLAFYCLGRCSPNYCLTPNMALADSKDTHGIDEESPKLAKDSAAVSESTGAETPVNTEKDVLSPQDGGKGAWMFLIGACIIEGVTWGQSLF